ncbi:MAG: hypothetical protein ACKVWR_12475 [Acidimicrobiales bacterium]
MLPGPTPQGGPSASGARPLLPLLVGAAVVLVLLVGGVFALTRGGGGGDDDQDEVAARSAGQVETSSTIPSASTPAASSAPAGSLPGAASPTTSAGAPKGPKQPVAMPTPVEGSIDNPGQERVYTYDAAAGDSLFFDSMKLDDRCPDSLYWRLQDANDKELFDTGMGGCGDKGPIKLDKAGQYRLTIYGYSGATGKFKFRVWPVPAPDAFTIKAGDVISPGAPGAGAGDVETPGVTDVYTLTAQAGEAFFFDAEKLDDRCPDSLYWRLQDANDKELFDTGMGGCGDKGPIKLDKAGQYRLTVYGYADATDRYKFKLWAVPAPQTFAMNLGDVVGPGAPGAGAGEIETPGVVDVYTFNGADGQTLFFQVNKLDDKCPNSLYWRLQDPNDKELFDTGMGGCGSRGPLKLDRAGSYKLTVYGFGDAAERYGFKVTPS